MKKMIQLSSLAFMLVGTSFLANAGVIDDKLAEFKKAGAKTANVERAKTMWTEEHKDAETGKMISCASCHGTDLKKEGKHYKTGKPIEPLAPSVNKERFTDAEKIDKWFGRNCKNVLSRECTPQEKMDFLSYLRTQ